MEKRIASPDERGRLKKFFGWNDEQIDHLTPKHWQVIDLGHKFAEYRLVAEVVDAQNCYVGAKLGEKYVFHASGFLLPHESSVKKFCLWALAPIVPFSYMVYDRIASGLDPTSFVIDRIGCMDVGINHAGFGKVIFKVYCEKAPKKK